MVREDYPGGFAGDSSNKFLASGRTTLENEAFDYVSKLARFRKSSSAIGSGSLMQYIPQKNLYVYFRYDSRQTILCALNTDTVAVSIHFKDYSERTSKFNTGTDIVSGQNVTLSDSLQIAPRTIKILELKKTSTDNKSVH